jgi:DNA-binding CsgD family transcriptional regulator
MMPLKMHYEAEVFFRRKGVIIAGVSLIRTREEGAFTHGELRIIEAASTFIERLIEHQLFLPGGQGDPAAKFTKREQDVIALVRAGFSNHRIAETLGLRLPTVKSHLQNIFAKMGIESRTALISRIVYGERRHAPLPIAPSSESVATPMLLSSPE